MEIHNLSIAGNKNVEVQLINMANAMGIKMAPSDISTAYRLPLKKDKIGKSVQRLYVKFTRRNMKRLFYGARKNKVTHHQLGFTGHDRIFIREHLNKSQADLYYKTKYKAKETSFKDIWTQEKNIYVRQNDTSKRILITTEQDLRQMDDGITKPNTAEETHRSLRSKTHRLNSTSGAH